MLEISVYKSWMYETCSLTSLGSTGFGSPLGRKFMVWGWLPNGLKGGCELNSHCISSIQITNTRLLSAGKENCEEVRGEKFLNVLMDLAMLNVLTKSIQQSSSWVANSCPAGKGSSVPCSQEHFTDPYPEPMK